jgi:hypothetical protein
MNLINGGNKTQRKNRAEINKTNICLVTINLKDYWQLRREQRILKLN